MNKTTKEYLNNCVLSLDAQIGDSDLEIKKRREQNVTSVVLRDDLNCLIKYLESHDDLPEPAIRAFNYCLSWNPFAKK